MKPRVKSRRSVGNNDRGPISKLRIDFSPIAVLLKISSDAAAGTNEAQGTATNRVCSLVSFLERREPLLRL